MEIRSDDYLEVLKTFVSIEEKLNLYQVFNTQATGLNVVLEIKKENDLKEKGYFRNSSERK